MTSESILEQLRFHYQSAKAVMSRIRQCDVDTVSGLLKVEAEAQALELHAQTVRMLARELIQRG